MILPNDEPGVYAIGDVAGRPWLPKASHEASWLLSTSLASRAYIHEPLMIPAVPTAPQVASVGLTEAQARKKVTN